MKTDPAVLEAVHTAMAHHIATRDQWDEPPAMYNLYLEDGQAAIPEDHPLIPQIFWHNASPPQRLREFAAALRSSGAGTMLSAHQPPSLIGVLFRVEMWMTLDAAAFDSLRPGDIARRADRIEARLAWVILRRQPGILISATLRRDQPGVVEIHSGGCMPSVDGLQAALIDFASAYMPALS